MNKTAIKNFAIWARKKLIAEITYKAGLVGITEKGIKGPLPQSTKDVLFFDIGTIEPYSITGVEIQQRKHLVDIIQHREKQSNYITAYHSLMEEVAYTWFNRLIAVRFMEVNDYLPSRVRVLSSESSTKIEPDLVTSPFEAELDYTSAEREQIIRLKNENKLDELFRLLFIKQCNELNRILPQLFEKTNDYTELLMNVSFTDKEGVVYRLVHDIPEDDFNVDKEGQIEIIGWLYQYYNSEPKDEAFELVKKNVKITKERIPAATQLFTPSWIVRYMVENSLGRLWMDSHPSEGLKNSWSYYLDEAQQSADAQAQLAVIAEHYKHIKPEDIKLIDPCMGSGHILVYAFDVLMQIYESYGYSQRDAARSIIENNLYGLDIDKRAYQLAYFALMMKARQYNRRILDGEHECHVYTIQESNELNIDHLQYFGARLSEEDKKEALIQMNSLVKLFVDAKEYGSLLDVPSYNWELLKEFITESSEAAQLSLDYIGLEDTRTQLQQLIELGQCMEHKYDVVITNPPYMGLSNGSSKLNGYVKKQYPHSKNDLFAVFIERCNEMTREHGYQAMITQHSWMFISTYEKLRLKILDNDMVNMAHLGARAFEEIAGEVVQTTAFVLSKSKLANAVGSYVRLVDYPSQREKEEAFLSGAERYNAPQDNFKAIPGVPFAYWVSQHTLHAFTQENLLRDHVTASVGIQTGDNEKFLRLWWEVAYDDVKFDAQSVADSYQHKKWFPYNKGGEFRKWYGNDVAVIQWDNDGEAIKRNSAETGHHYQQYADALKFQPMVTWSRISTGSPAFRLKGAGYLSDMAGFSLYSTSTELEKIIAFCNSAVAKHYLSFLAPTLNFMVGPVTSMPFAQREELEGRIISLVQQAMQVSREDWNAFEASWDYARHPWLNGSSLQEAYQQWEQACDNRFNELKAIEEELNSLHIEMYGLQQELSAEVEPRDVTIRKADLARDIRGFVSYAVGCMFGRYSLDVEGLAYAGGTWEPSKYSSFRPDEDNIILITDEEYFTDDIVGLFVSFVKAAYGGAELEDNLNFIAKALGNRGNSSREVIRNYFLKDFYKDHCKLYQKRPIYWQFESGKEDGFKALIYIHRYNEDIIGNLRIDHLHALQRIYESEIRRMQDIIEQSEQAREVTAATKRREKLTRQLKETKAYDEKIANLALARISIVTDDGVKINYDKIQRSTEGEKLEVLAKI